MPLDGLHSERDRAESFGSAAEQYDLYRPGYPPALIDDLLVGQPSNALDIGCTGKVARALIERGLPVLGIEPDLRMAQVARRYRVPIEVASFESWEPAGRTYDLLTAGHSWHWVDPVIGLAKAASVTAPGGTVALFWNYHQVEQGLLTAFEDVYRTYAPALPVVGRHPSGKGDRDRDPFADSTDLCSLGSRTYQWLRVQDADGWTSMLGTLSDHARLGQPRLGQLQLGLREAIEQAGGLVRSQCGTYVWTARRGKSANP